MGREARLRELRKQIRPFVGLVAKHTAGANELLHRGFLGRMKWLLFGR